MWAIYLSIVAIGIVAFQNTNKGRIESVTNIISIRNTTCLKIIQGGRLKPTYIYFSFIKLKQTVKANFEAPTTYILRQV